MPTVTLITLLTALSIVSFAVPASARDWPQWRGPGQPGVSLESSWSSNWGKDGPPAIWKRSVGTGFSSFAVSEGRVVTMGHANGTDGVFCLHAYNGSLLWEHRYECPLWDHEHEGGPGATPSIADDHVYTLSREGHLFCLHLKTGAVKWQKNLRSQFSVGKKPAEPYRDYGYTGSPIVMGKLLVVPVGGKNANTVAFDRITGKVIWTSGNTKSQSGTGYGSAVPFSWLGKSFIALLMLKDLEILETETGRQVATFPWVTDYGNNNTDPCIHENRIFITTDFGKGGVGLEFDGKNLKEVFRRQDTPCKMGSPIVSQGHIYASTTSGTLKCIDMKTGEVRWKQRGLRQGSLLLAGDRFLYLGERGDLVAARMTPTAYSEVARAKVHDGRCWTPPVLANGLLYVRNSAGDVVCLDLLSPGPRGR